MLYVVTGEEITSRGRVISIVNSLKKRKQFIEVCRITDEDDSYIDYLIKATGLFEKKHIVIIERDISLDYLPSLQDSQNLFILLSQKTDKKFLKECEKYSEKVEVVEKKEEERFNIFSLTDALTSRDREKLWVLYHKALNENISPEEIQGVIYWQLDSLLRAEKAGSAEDALMKSYPYKKSKSALKNFKGSEIYDNAQKVLEALLLSRRGGNVLKDRLEILIARGI